VASGYENFTLSEGEVDYGETFGKLATFACSIVKPDNVGTGVRSILESYDGNIDVRYSTPAVKLITDGNKVTGVYAKDSEGAFYKFTALKGVVIATGDYQNNLAMVEKLCPDVLHFERKQYNRTGDGQLMGMMAGAVLEPIGHTKILHDFDSGPMWNEPFLCLDLNGNRIFNEETDMAYIANYMRDYEPDKAGKYCPIFDSNGFDQVAEWGGRPSSEEAIQKYMPDSDMEERSGVLEDRIAVYKADTLDELADKLGIPAENLKASVERYNEVVDMGWDPDFGKDPKYLKKIEKAPFWGIGKHLRLTAIAAGIITDETGNVLDEEQNPIENLYAIGNVAGPFYGSADYPMVFGGLSLGRCVTQGYVLGKDLAAK
ncbi:FAD-binding protein, partial [bacterium]|nr:FAD-binding protein [candidate division CSSED10-310 bacterium]